MIRHSFATEMGKKVAPKVLSILLGHGCGDGDLRVTNRYIHSSEDDQRRAMRQADIGRRSVKRTPPPTSPQTEAPNRYRAPFGSVGQQTRPGSIFQPPNRRESKAPPLLRRRLSKNPPPDHGLTTNFQLTLSSPTPVALLGAS